MRKRLKLKPDDFDLEVINRAYAVLTSTSIEAVTLIAFPKRNSHSHTTLKLVIAFLAYRSAPEGLRKTALAAVDSAVLDYLSSQVLESMCRRTGDDESSVESQ